jgi:hypothetical protein
VRPHRLTRQYPAATLLLALTVGCEQPAVSADATQRVDSAGVQLTTIVRAPDSLPAWRLSPNASRILTGTSIGDSTALSLIGQVRWLADGGLIVADPGALRLLLFDSAGTFVRALGRSGAGPGELRNIVSVEITPGDSISTYDAALRRLTIWHPRAGFTRLVALGDDGSLESWPADAWRWSDSQHVVLRLSTTPRPELSAGATVTRWPMRAQLSMHDREGRVLHTSPAFDAMYTGVIANGDTRLPFSNQPFVAPTRDRIYFGSGAEFVLRYLTPSLALNGELRWPLREEPLSPTEVTRVRDDAMARLAQRAPLDPARSYFAREFAPEILPKNRPAIARVFIDDEARIWVERFEPVRLGSAEQAMADQWTVLHADGTPIATLQLPANTRLESVRRNRAAVVQRDSLDVQSLAVYEILPVRQRQ